MILWAFITAGAISASLIALLKWSLDVAPDASRHVGAKCEPSGDPAREVQNGLQPQLMEQLEWAELWFSTTSADANGAIPCDRAHGLWLFRAAIARIKELEQHVHSAKFDLKHWDQARRSREGAQ